MHTKYKHKHLVIMLSQFNWELRLVTHLAKYIRATCLIVISTILYAKFTEEKIPDKTISVFWSNPWTNFKHFSGYWLICYICYCICIYVLYFGSEINIIIYYYYYYMITWLHDHMITWSHHMITSHDHMNSQFGSYWFLPFH